MFVHEHERIGDFLNGRIGIGKHKFCKFESPVEQILVGRRAEVFYKFPIDL